ncbi:MAG TPA: DUF1345 domain-containing protein [Pseudolysinimonas sp.]|nr:DUF1345 domain-containing protein [Pseudolysinimonas sp.]
MPATQNSRTTVSRARLLVMLVAGVAVSVATGLTLGWSYAPTLGWGVSCIVYIGWVWGAVMRLDGPATKDHAHREDPTTVISELLTLVASVASIGAVVILIVAAKNAHGITAVLVPVLAVVSLALSWFLIHTLFTLRYARLYFEGRPGGIEFNQTQTPRYLDFAYLAFTLGMTYQVSDTALQASQIRAVALRQALLSYLFGAVILAATINLVAGLAN